jgi:predicted ArsR family transcriptional regulator
VRGLPRRRADESTTSDCYFWGVARTGGSTQRDDGVSDAWPLVAVLSEPRRREVYDFVAAHDDPVTRDDVAEGLSIARSLAAFHLDKLADSDLLEVSFGRPPGRPGGPGAGRPSKRYVVSRTQIDVSVPRRRYDIAGRILAKAVALSSGRRSKTAAEVAITVAREEGQRLGEAHAAPGRATTQRALTNVEETLSTVGYQPAIEGTSVRLRNCPFHSLTEVAPRLVCEVNESFIAGVVCGLGSEDVVEADLCGPTDGDCCVVVRSRDER